MSNLSWLPDLVMLEDFGGDWNHYLEALYDYFCQDFVHTRPSPFEGKPFRLKRHPLLEGKEATFWHFISEGKVEAERLPDLRRCERIRWPRSLIDAVASDKVRYWAQQGRREPRVAIALEDFSYVVILADRRDYVLPWTAYCVEHEFRRRRLQKEYEEAQSSTKS